MARNRAKSRHAVTGRKGSGPVRAVAGQDQRAQPLLWTADPAKIAICKRVLGERGKIRFNGIAERYPGMFAQVRSFGMLFAAEFQPVLPPRMSLGQQRLIGELTGILGLLMWHRAGVQANLSLNSRRTVRLTPALTIPEHLFDQMFDRIEMAAEEHEDAWHMLTHTPPRTLYELSKFALKD